MLAALLLINIRQLGNQPTHPDLWFYYESLVQKGARVKAAPPSIQQRHHAPWSPASPAPGLGFAWGSQVAALSSQPLHKLPPLASCNLQPHNHSNPHPPHPHAGPLYHSLPPPATPYPLPPFELSLRQYHNQVPPPLAIFSPPPAQMTDKESPYISNKNYQQQRTTTPYIQLHATLVRYFPRLHRLSWGTTFSPQRPSFRIETRRRDFTGRLHSLACCLQTLSVPAKDVGVFECSCVVGYNLPFNHRKNTNVVGHRSYLPGSAAPSSTHLASTSWAVFHDRLDWGRRLLHLTILDPHCRVNNLGVWIWSSFALFLLSIIAVVNFWLWFVSPLLYLFYGLLWFICTM